jgi:hypothetical protein
MRVVNCVALTRGELSGSPSFAAFEDIKVALTQVRRGDLFIAGDDGDIPKALELGAYGILYDFDYTPTDDETAWIRVRNATDAAMVIAKYLLLNKHLRFVLTDAVSFDMARKITKDSSVAFLDDYDLVALFAAIKNDNKKIYVSFGEEFLHGLTNEPIENFIAQRDKLTGVGYNNIFETVLQEGESVRALKLPLFLLKYLRNATKILDDINAKYEISDIKHSKFFDPVFVDDSLKERDFGKTSKVIIFSEYESQGLLRECIDFIRQSGKWGRLSFLLHSSLMGFDDDEVIITYFSSDAELLDMLDGSDFNFALVVGAGRKIISKEKKEQISLF